MSDFIGVDIQGIDELNAKLNDLPIEAQDAGVEAGLEYIQNVARGYEPYKFVTRKAAYGVSFFTEKQRRWFFAALRSGEINPGVKNRTQALSKHWKIHGEGRKAFLANDLPYAGYVMGKDDQSRHEAAVGWVTIEDRIKKHMGKLIEKFDAGVKKAIKKLKL